MSLFAEYYKEISGAEVIELEGAFASIIEQPEAYYIHEFYVKPELREQGIGTSLMRKIEGFAAERHKKLLLSSVDLGMRTAALSLKAQLAYGFVPFSAEQGKIFLRKEVGGIS